MFIFYGVRQPCCSHGLFQDAICAKKILYKTILDFLFMIVQLHFCVIQILLHVLCYLSYVICL